MERNDGIARMNDEFDAAEKLAKQYRRIQLTPVVDNDFPAVKHDYDGAADVFVAAALANGRRPVGRPKVVCLCGSTRFYDVFQQANYDETMAGNIVLSVGFYPHGDSTKTEHGENIGITPEQKSFLDVLHKKKIDLADEVFVLNVGGYIGDSTRSEVEHARKTGKPIRWLEQP